MKSLIITPVVRSPLQTLQALPVRALPQVVSALECWRPANFAGQDQVLGFRFGSPLAPPRLFYRSAGEAFAQMELGGGRALSPPIFLASSEKREPPAERGFWQRWGLGRLRPGRRATNPSAVPFAQTRDGSIPPGGGRIQLSLAATPSVDMMSVEFVRIAGRLPPPLPIAGLISREGRALLEHGRLAPRIVNLRELSRTNMGLVLVGMDQEHGRITVIKTSNPEHFRDIGGTQPAMVEKFRREMALIAAIQHEGVLEVYFFGIGENGQPFMATPYLRGWGEAKTWKDLLNQRQTPSELLTLDGNLNIPKFVGELALPVCDAFIFLHAIGITHGDIKPENIGLQGRQPKVMDFGLATTLAEGGTHGGTPGYFPPETFLGGEISGPQQDIFSLAMTLYVMLVGYHPFAYINDTTLHEQPTGEWLPYVVSPSQLRSELGEDFDPVIMKGLALDPNDRFQTMTEFRDALRRALKLWEAKPFLQEAEQHFDAAQGIDLQKQYGAWQTRMISATTVLERARDILRDYPEEYLDERLGRWYLELFLEEEKRGRGEIYEGIITARFPVQAKFIRTKGEVAVAIDDPKTEATLVSYTDRDGVFVESELPVSVSLQDLQEGFSLPRGHYALRFEQGGFLPMQYPFKVERGETTNLQVKLYPAALIPAGFAVVSSSPPLLVKRTLVTNREYINFLDALIAAGSSGEALQHLPRVGPGKFLWHEETILAIKRNKPIGAEVYFSKSNSNERDNLILLDGPVAWISVEDAEAWTHWASQNLGKNLRLPSREEWHNMASPDGRARPWGEAPFVEGASNVRRPQQVEGMHVSQVGYYVMDTSPLSHPDRPVVDVWGNAREFTRDQHQLADGRSMRVSVGSGFSQDAYAPVSDFWIFEEDRPLPHGFRVVADLS